MKRLLSAVALAGLSTASASASQTGIEARGPNGPLKGTFTSGGASPSPVVLIIPGSGPTDRDGNNPLGIKASTYRLLAENLASEHIATVRIDKRGMFGSASAVPDANAVTIGDYVSDTSAWIDAVRTKNGSDCVWLLGHSEGGLVALASARTDARVCGVVLVAAAGRPLGDVLKAQIAANPANTPLLDQATAAIDALAAGRRIDPTSTPPALASLFHPAVQGFLISAFALDPAKLIGQIQKPVLIVQGERDIQIGVSDAQRLKNAAPSATLALLPDTNHVLKRVVSDDRAANIATYGDPTLPLAPGAAEVIAKFVKAGGVPETREGDR